MAGKKITRREVLKKAVYVTPVILTLAAKPSIARAGSHAIHSSLQKGKYSKGKNSKGKYSKSWENPYSSRKGKYSKGKGKGRKVRYSSHKYSSGKGGKSGKSGKRG